MNRFTHARLGGFVAVVAVALSSATPAFAGEDPAIASAIMALARSQWAAEVAGKSAADQMATVADDYTEFNPGFPTRIDGKAMATGLLAADTGAKTVFADMQNAKVQVYGDTAILTYNFAGVVKDTKGEISNSTAKSTRVYVKQGNDWKLVHANFAPVEAPN